MVLGNPRAGREKEEELRGWAGVVQQLPTMVRLNNSSSNLWN